MTSVGKEKKVSKFNKKYQEVKKLANGNKRVGLIGSHLVGKWQEIVILTPDLARNVNYNSQEFYGKFSQT